MATQRYVRRKKMSEYDLVIKNLVVDDLREFDPPLLSDDVMYCRTLHEALDLLNIVRVSIDNLWLDFDLGGDDTSLIFMRGLVGAVRENTPYAFKWDVQNLYIITANPIGRKQLLDLANEYLIDTNIFNVRAEDHHLVYQQKYWSENLVDTDDHG